MPFLYAIGAILCLILAILLIPIAILAFASQYSFLFVFIGIIIAVCVVSRSYFRSKKTINIHKVIEKIPDSDKLKYLEKKYCPYCGTRIHIYDDNCPKCGANIDDSSED